MAKKRKSTHTTTNKSRRVTSANAKRSLPRPTMTPSLNFGGPILLLEDRRQWHPDGPHRSARGFTTTAPDPALREPHTSRGGNSFRPYSAQTKAIVGFKAPKKVAVCIRRKQRKEIIHALGVAGGKVAKPRRNELSNTHC